METVEDDICEACLLPFELHSKDYNMEIHL